VRPKDRRSVAYPLASQSSIGKSDSQTKDKKLLNKVETEFGGGRSPKCGGPRERKRRNGWRNSNDRNEPRDKIKPQIQPTPTKSSSESHTWRLHLTLNSPPTTAYVCARGARVQVTITSSVQPCDEAFRFCLSFILLFFLPVSFSS
jgi:hypothetical protein